MKLTRRYLLAPVACVALVLGSGCSERDTNNLAPARGNIDPVVFADGYSDDVYFQPFFETHYTAVSQDSVFAYEGFAPDGAKSLRINVPPVGSALGPYSGGVLTSSASRDLADFNALTFYARTDLGTVAAPIVALDVVGFGNDNTGTSLHAAGRGNLSLTPEWTFHIVPIPAPSKLIAERGLFLFAEAPLPGYPQGYNIWIDEIRFAKLGNIEPFRPSMDSVTRQYFVGSTVNPTNTRTIFRVDGSFVPVDHAPAYFDYVSSDPAVAAVGRTSVRVVGEGQAVISAELEGAEVQGKLTVTGYLPPTVAAAAPTLPAAKVISMFSDAYNDVPVDTWNTQWGGSTARVEDYVVAGDNAKLYTGLNFVGIEFLNPLIDASGMNAFHLDILAPAGTNFGIKMISFPPGLAGSVETAELTLGATTTPAFNSGQWSSLDIPLSDFQLPDDWSWAHIGQMAFVTSDAQLVLVDNVYWHE